MLYLQLKLIDERKLQHRFKDNLVLKSYLVTKNQNYLVDNNQRESYSEFNHGYQ